jgi:transcriptional regulatory protein LevR
VDLDLDYCKQFNGQLFTLQVAPLNHPSVKDLPSRFEKVYQIPPFELYRTSYKGTYYDALSFYLETIIDHVKNEDLTMNYQRSLVMLNYIYEKQDFYESSLQKLKESYKKNADKIQSVSLENFITELKKIRQKTCP